MTQLLLESKIPPEDHIRKAVKFLKDNRGVNDKEQVGTGSYNARMGCVNKSGEVLDRLYMCHKRVNELENATVSFSTLIRNTMDWTKESADAWFDWVLDPVESPWKEAFPKEGYVLDGVDVNSKEFMTTYGFVFWHVHILPSNVQHQAFIASRMATEWPFLIRCWHDLVNTGLSREFALAFLPMWNGTPASVEGDAQTSTQYEGFFKKEKFRLSIDNFYDFPLDVYTCDEEYILNFLSHKMVGPKNPPFAESPKYTPVNCLWGANGWNLNKNHWAESDWLTTPEIVANRYSTKFKDRYKHLGEEIESVSSLGRPRTNFQFTKDAFFEIAKEEQKRLYGLLVHKR